MKRFTLIAVGVVAVAAGAVWIVQACAQSPRPGERPVEAKDGHDLTVAVTEVSGKEGSILIALFTKSDGFPDDFAKAAYTAKVKADKPTHTFEKLPAGKYVVVVAHDRNGNGKIDKSPFGQPKEPIGLSHHPKIGPSNRPDFEKAKVDVSKATSLEVNLIEFGK